MKVRFNRRNGRTFICQFGGIEVEICHNTEYCEYIAWFDKMDCEMDTYIDIISKRNRRRFFHDLRHAIARVVSNSDRFGGSYAYGDNSGNNGVTYGSAEDYQAERMSSPDAYKHFDRVNDMHRRGWALI